MDPNRYGQPVDPNAPYAGPPETANPFTPPSNGQPPGFGPAYGQPVPFGPPGPYGQPSQQGQPPYGQPGFGQAPPYGPPSYGQPYGQAPYGQAPYGVGYPTGAGYYPQSDARPGIVVAAAVLSYVTAGLLLLTGVFLLLGVSAVSNLNDGYDTTNDTAKFLLAALANLVSGALLIAGGVTITGRRPLGRTLITVGAAICTLAGIFWLAQSTDTVIWVFLFCSPPIIATIFVFNGGVGRWLSGIAVATPRPSPYGY